MVICDLVIIWSNKGIKTYFFLVFVVPEILNFLEYKVLFLCFNETPKS